MVVFQVAQKPNIFSVFLSLLDSQQALETIIKQPSTGNMAYAQNYAMAAIQLGGSTEAEMVESEFGIEIKRKPTGKMMVGNELKVQILYILSNLGGWKGEEDREVKKFLKSIK